MTGSIRLAAIEEIASTDPYDKDAGEWSIPVAAIAKQPMTEWVEPVFFLRPPQWAYPVIKDHSQPGARVMLIRPCFTALARKSRPKTREQRFVIVLVRASSIGFVWTEGPVTLGTTRFYSLERWCVSTFREKLHSECFVLTIDRGSQLHLLLLPIS